MTDYAHIVEGVEDRGPGPLPRGWNRGEVVPQDVAPSVSALLERNWYEVRRTADPIDPATQKAGTEVLASVEADHAVYHTPAVAKTAGEQTAHTRRQAEQQVSDHFARIAVLQTELLVGIANAVDPNIVSNLSPLSAQTRQLLVNLVSDL